MPEDRPLHHLSREDTPKRRVIKAQPEMYRIPIHVRRVMVDTRLHDLAESSPELPSTRPERVNDRLRRVDLHRVTERLQPSRVTAKRARGDLPVLLQNLATDDARDRFPVPKGLAETFQIRLHAEIGRGPTKRPAPPVYHGIEDQERPDAIAKGPNALEPFDIDRLPSMRLDENGRRLILMQDIIQVEPVRIRDHPGALRRCAPFVPSVIRPIADKHDVSPSRRFRDPIRRMARLATGFREPDLRGPRRDVL